MTIPYDQRKPSSDDPILRHRILAKSMYKPINFRKNSMTQYYLIRVDAHVRLEKAANAKEACRLAFGTVYSGTQAYFKALGTRNPKYYTVGKKKELYGNKDWIPMGDT